MTLSSYLIVVYFFDFRKNLLTMKQSNNETIQQSNNFSS